MGEKFRSPRKLKKKLKKGSPWFYPIDEDNNYLVAFPGGNQEDYDAYKNGVLTNVLFDIIRSFKNKKYELEKDNSRS